MEPPTPPEPIPDFLVERLTELSPATLRDVAEYARDTRTAAPETIPESIVTPFALQDDETLAEIADYADAVAAFLEERDAESLAEVDESEENVDEEWSHKRILEWHG